MRLFKPGKYIQIIASIAIFLVLYACILGLNYFISLEISDDARAMQLASRQTRLNQQILSELYIVQDSLETGESIEESILALTQTFRQFDEVIDSFIYGGELIGVGQGQESLLVDTNYAKVNLHLLKQIEALWRPYRARISPVMYSIYEYDLNNNELDREKILDKAKVAIAVARETNPEMLALLIEFSIAVETLAENKVSRLQTIQGIGIVIAVLYVIVLMLYFIRTLGKSDRAAETARGETEEILATVNEGLFLLNRDLKMGSQHSKTLCTMLNRTDLGGENFIDLIRPMVSESTLKTTEEFLNLMFEEHVQASLIQSLNPLGEVEIQISKAQGEFELRHYRFQFSPVEEEGKLLHILVSITDLTDRIRLEAELDKSKRESSQEIELLLSIIHIQPDLLASGLSSTQNGLKEINDLLKTPATRTEHLWKKHREIGRVAHRIKGDCAAIELNSIADAMHELEDLLATIKSHKKVTGNDFLPVALKLNQLHKQIALVKDAIDRMNNLRKAFKKTSKAQSDLAQGSDKKSTADTEPDNWAAMIRNFATGIGKQYDKQLSIDLTGLDHSHIPSGQTTKLRDAIVQLVRNAAVHGIEAPAERVKHGKSPAGTIDVYSKTTENKHLLYIRDDGRGIDLDEIRTALKKKHGLDNHAIAEISPKKLVKKIFEPGFSTADTVDMNAGRGVGLDLVKSSLERCGAKLSLRFKEGVYTEFKISIPKSSELAEAARQ